MIRAKKICIPAAAFLVCLSLSACRSAYVQTAIVNHSGNTARLIEVDYPDASFGVQQILNSATFHYRFKILGSGPVKIAFTGNTGTAFTATGPTLSEGQQGSLTITLENDGKVTWAPELSDPK